jgi:hypothetical protein
MKAIDVMKFSIVGLVVVGAIGLVGCSSAQPTGDPGVDRVGKYLLKSQTPSLEVVIGYRFAQQKLGSDWLLLETAITSPTGAVGTVERKDVSVTTPAGEKIPLATQREFNEAYGTLQSFLNAADVVRDPMDYWAPRRKSCIIQFYVEPGEGVSFDQVSVNDQLACQGRFLFQIPGGVQPGRYVLNIDQKDGGITIPVTFEKK